MMEETTRPSEETFGAPQGHPKPMLTVGQQIARMKAKGVTFDPVSEEEAAMHLRAKCQFFRIYAHRELFDRHVGGARDASTSTWTSGTSRRSPTSTGCCATRCCP